MTIYFIRAGKDGPIKIGYTSNNPTLRMSDIQVGCPYRLDIMGCIEGSLQDERYLHLKLSAHNTTGEWFEPHADVISVVKEAIATGIAVPFSAPGRPRHANAANEIIDILGGNSVVADLTESKPNAVSNWRRQGFFPANTFVALRCALADRGIDAPPSLWGMRPVLSEQESAA